MNLTRFLTHETKRGKMSETGSPGMKTPLVMKTVFHEDLEDFFVSDSSGKMVHRNNAEGGVPSAFFPLDPSDEDTLQAIIADRVFQRGCELDWGNVLITSDFTDQDFGDYLSYFEAYDLEFAQVFCGYRGFETLRETGRMVYPGENATFDEDISPEALRLIRDAHIAVGFLHYRPVFLNESLDPYVIFAAAPTAVGLCTRIGDFVSVVLHNPERGVIIARLDNSNDDGTPEDDQEH